MKTLFKSFTKGGYYYGVALYILILFILDAQEGWWIFSTIFFAVLFCFVDYFATLEIRNAFAGESYWRNQYFMEKDSHKGTKKYYINKIKDIDKQVIEKMTEAEHIGYIRGMDRAQEITDKVFKEAK